MRILLFMLLASTAWAQDVSPPIASVKMPDGSLVITMSAAKVAECGVQGGCRLVSMAEMSQFIEQIKPQLCNEKSL